MNKNIDYTVRVDVYENRPEGFNPIVEVAACYIKIGEKLLLLQRAANKLEGTRWGVPAGKLEINETPEQGARRELFEETGIRIDSNSRLHSLGALYIRKPEVDYVYHMFKIKLDIIPEVCLSDEHLDYIWVTLSEVKDLALMSGAEEALKIYLQRSSKKLRSGTSVNVYLILRKDHKLLLSLRKNTGYCDGYYGLVAGHVEDGESATAAMIREAFEEAGIYIKASDLTVVHVLHRQTNRLNMDIFFECHSWEGVICNQEPEKCEALEFHSNEHLPENMIDYIADVLRNIQKEQFYSEYGWGK